MTTTDWIQAISAAIAAIVTGVLVRITYIYVRETKRIARSTEKQTELSLRPFVIISAFEDFAGVALRLVYKNIGHSPAIDVWTEPSDQGAYIIEFMKHGLIDTEESRKLKPKGKGKDVLSDGLIHSVPTPSYIPKDLDKTNSNIELILTIHYKNIEKVPYQTKVKISRTGIDILSTEKV